MAEFTERRRYQRCTKTICKAFIHTGRRFWEDIETEDISAGGLKFTSEKLYEINHVLQFNLVVYNAFSEFSMNFEGIVARRETKRNSYTYGIKFVNVNKYQQVQLDEIIKAKITLKNDSSPLYEDGMYAFMFIPKTKKRIPSVYR